MRFPPLAPSGLAICLALGCYAAGAGCGESAEAGDPAPTAAAPAASPNVDDPESWDEGPDDLGEEPDDGAPLPLEEMDQAALESACFRGRQGACDLLGH